MTPRHFVAAAIVAADIDDSTITTQIKGRFVDDKAADASNIPAETLNGTVLLSGFAKNTAECLSAERIARGVNGVMAVRNEIDVRP